MNKNMISLITFFFFIMIGTYMYITNIHIKTIDHVKNEELPKQLKKFLEAGRTGMDSKYITEKTWYDSYMKSYVENGKTYVLVRTIAAQGGTVLDVTKKIKKNDVLEIYYHRETIGMGGLRIEPMNTLLIVDGEYKIVVGFEKVTENGYEQSKDYDILYDLFQKSKE